MNRIQGVGVGRDRSSNPPGRPADSGSNVMDVYVRHIPQKLGAHRIETVRGAGYHLSSDVES